MKAQFEIKNFLTSNREVIIAKHEALKLSFNYSGISLKNFMLDIMNAMIRNNVNSEKTAASKLPFLMGDIFCENSKIESRGFISNKVSENISKFN